ncbi:hypothetical protein F5876DRAFT_71016, partial [Lentinula aff. lateritia]
THRRNAKLYRPHSEHIQGDVTKAIGVLLKAACTKLGINPPGDVRRSFQVYGYIGKMDLKTFQYHFVVQIFSGGNELMEGSVEDWIKCKGRVGYIYDYGKMVVSGRVVNPAGKPIVTMNSHGSLVSESSKESSGDSHKPTKTGGKKVQWADPLESHQRMDGFFATIFTSLAPRLIGLMQYLPSTPNLITDAWLAAIHFLFCLLSFRQATNPTPLESSQSLLLDMYFLRHHRVVQTTNNFVIAMLYSIFILALVPSILAAAVPNPGTLNFQRRIPLRSTYPVNAFRRAKLDPRGGAQSAVQTFEMIQMSDVSATETAKLMQRAVAIIHFPNPTPPSKKFYSKQAQKRAIEGTSKLLEAAMTELGINLPDSELRKAILVYGSIGKPDPTRAQYDFKVEFLSLPEDSGGDSHDPAETGGKASKVHWADSS